MKSRKSTFCKEFWIEKGLSEEEAVNKINDIQDRCRKNKLKKKLQKFEKEVWLNRGWSEEECYDKNIEAKRKDEIFSKLNNLKRLSPLKIQYWIHREYSEEQATVKVGTYKHQKSETSKNAIDHSKPRAFSKQFWINKGMSEEEATNKVSEIQRGNSKKVKNHPSIYDVDILMSQRNISKEEAEEIIKDRKIKTNVFTVGSWVSRGYSEDDAKHIVHDIQKGNQEKRGPNKKEETNTFIEYYIKRGYPDAEQALRERQSTRSLHKYVERYGEEEGLRRYNETIAKFLETGWYSKTPEEKIELTIKRTQSSNFYSKSSIIFFEKLIENIDLADYSVRWKDEEYLIRYNNGIFFYDFCIPELKFMVEYNGIRYHPNKEKMTDEDFSKWTQLCSKKTAQEVYEKDTFKNNLAIEHGFDLFIIWEDDNLQTQIKKLRYELENRIETRRNSK